MVAKASLVICAAALLVQSVYSTCLGGLGAPYGYAGCGYNKLAPGLAYDGFAATGLGYGYGCGSGVASTGGGLAVASASPIAPVGVSVLSENAYEGVLAAGGNLPFLGSVGIEGVLPTAGAGAVSYGCGDGAIGIASEGPIATGIAAPGALFPPGSPSTVATADALALAGNGLGYNGIGYNGLGYGLGYNGLGGIAGYGGAGCGYGYNRAGCGCGALY